MKSRLSLSGVLILFTFFSYAQSSGEIIGKLTDSLTNQPIPFAGVSLERDGEIIMQSETENNGAFYFKPVRPGNYELKITSVGYQGITLVDVYVHGVGITYLNLSMTATSYEIPPIIVTWKDERDIINEIPHISGEDLKNSGSRDAGQMAVKTVPTVYNPDGGDKGGIYIAGSRADATLYVIDGIRVEGSTYLPKSSIEEIVVYTFGIPAKYGDVTGGVIEITTKSVGVY
ncbi:MAG: carboxypeptidase regulatory-like domain-containing protein [Chitinophagales bacterium]|nr:carboxypeptidase regulatory-like domain-containing protein [Chitinophagales bacterium]